VSKFEDYIPPITNPFFLNAPLDEFFSSKI
jgi:hypothetical protein